MMYPGAPRNDTIANNPFPASRFGHREPSFTADDCQSSSHRLNSSQLLFVRRSVVFFSFSLDWYHHAAHTKHFGRTRYRKLNAKHSYVHERQGICKKKQRLAFSSLFIFGVWRKKPRSEIGEKSMKCAMRLEGGAGGWNGSLRRIDH